MARWQLSASAVTIVPFSRSIAKSFGTAVISFDFASVAICASTRRCSQPQAQTLAVDRHNPFAWLGEAGHEPLKRRPELLRVEHAEKPAERVMTGHAILEPEKAAQERLLRLGEQAHVHRALPAAQNRAHRYRQNLMKVVQRRIAGARVVQTVPAFDKPIQHLLPAPRIIRDPVESISFKTQNPANVGGGIPNAIPLGDSAPRKG